MEERILKDGLVMEGDVLKVDSFLNHQMDVTLFRAMAEENGLDPDEILSMITG